MVHSRSPYLLPVTVSWLSHIPDKLLPLLLLKSLGCVLIFGNVVMWWVTLCLRITQTTCLCSSRRLKTTPGSRPGTTLTGSQHRSLPRVPWRRGEPRRVAGTRRTRRQQSNRPPPTTACVSLETLSQWAFQNWRRTFYMHSCRNVTLAEELLTMSWLNST